MSFDGAAADELVARAHERARAGEPLRLSPLGDADAALAAWAAVAAPELAAQAHRAARAHLDACWGWYDVHEHEPGGPASAWFCGCVDCEIREVLHAAWPIFAAAS